MKSEKFDVVKGGCDHSGDVLMFDSGYSALAGVCGDHRIFYLPYEKCCKNVVMVRMAVYEAKYKTVNWRIFLILSTEKL